MLMRGGKIRHVPMMFAAAIAAMLGGKKNKGTAPTPEVPLPPGWGDPLVGRHRRIKERHIAKAPTCRVCGDVGTFVADYRLLDGHDPVQQIFRCACGPVLRVNCS